MSRLQRPCMRDRWGKGSGCAEKLPDSAAAKEVEAKLANMLEERLKQDAKWSEPIQTDKPVKK